MAIATAAIGFGIFGSAFEVGVLVAESGFARGVQLGKVVGILSAGVFYFLVLLSSIGLLQNDQATGQRLVQGPLQWLYMEMVSLAGLYLLDLIEELAGN